MTKSTYLIAVFALMLLAVPAMAQSGAQDRAAQLRSQLADVQAQQTALQTRLDQINEDIKPENIERSLAGVGSTHPEDLREARRRQLETQRQGTQSQLDNLAATRARLEAAIAAAEAQSYRGTVGPNASTETTVIPKSNKAVVSGTIPQKHRVKKRRRHRRRKHHASIGIELALQYTGGKNSKPLQLPVAGKRTEVCTRPLHMS